MRNKINVISNLVVIILVISASVFSRESGAPNQKSVAKVSEGVNQNPGISVMNINNHAFWVAKDGAYTTGGSNNGVQGDYPKFTGGLIFADGMLWGAKVKDVPVLDADGNATGQFETGSQKVQVGGSTYYHGLSAGRVIYDDDGNYNPLSVCCEEKTCSDWLNDGNSCIGFPSYQNPENRNGYSENECCYRLCDNWGGAGNTCDEGEVIITGKLGWGKNECCTDKKNTCFDKSWDCPANTIINVEALDTVCSCGSSECEETCEENDTNIESCCSSFQTCSNMLCPAKYHQNLLNKDEYCKENILKTT